MRKISLTPLSAVAVLWLVWAVVAIGAETDRLPLTLNVFNFDRKLNAFLLSGDYHNVLAKPLRAWRGQLQLTDSRNNETISFFLEQQARRPVLPDEWAVWSVWIDLRAGVPEHDALQRFAREHTRVVLKLLRVLYADGGQQAFQQE